MKITTASSCEESWILTSSIIDIETNSNYSLNVIISIGPITCSHFYIILLYMLKAVITNTTISDWSWSRNGSHKWSTNSYLHAFSGWTVTENLFIRW